MNTPRREFQAAYAALALDDDEEPPVNDIGVELIAQMYELTPEETELLIELSHGPLGCPTNWS